jgi:hypothetical protein
MIVHFDRRISIEAKSRQFAKVVEGRWILGEGDAEMKRTYRNRMVARMSSLAKFLAEVQGAADQPINYSLICERLCGKRRERRNLL